MNSSSKDEYIHVATDRLHTHQALDFDLYDQHGRLLLAKGQPIGGQTHLDRIIGFVPMAWRSAAMILTNANADRYRGVFFDPIKVSELATVSETLNNVIRDETVYRDPFIVIERLVMTHRNTLCMMEVAPDSAEAPEVSAPTAFMLSEDQISDAADDLWRSSKNSKPIRGTPEFLEDIENRLQLAARLLCVALNRFPDQAQTLLAWQHCQKSSVALRPNEAVAIKQCLSAMMTARTLLPTKASNELQISPDIDFKTHWPYGAMMAQLIVGSTAAEQFFSEADSQGSPNVHALGNRAQSIVQRILGWEEHPVSDLPAGPHDQALLSRSAAICVASQHLTRLCSAHAAAASDTAGASSNGNSNGSSKSMTAEAAFRSTLAAVGSLSDSQSALGWPGIPRWMSPALMTAAMKSLAQSIGLHPMGSVVELANKEIGVCIGTLSAPGGSTAQSARRVLRLVKSDGTYASNVFLRDTNEPDFAIKGSIAHAQISSAPNFAAAFSSAKSQAAQPEPRSATEPAH